MIKRGHIYVAPPDHHLLVKRGHISVVQGAIENGHRPAIDPMFRTAANSYGGRVVGVILSGSRDDGVAGMVRIKEGGGATLVQSPEEALYPSMPTSTIETIEVDLVAPIAELASRLIELVNDPAEDPGTPDYDVDDVEMSMTVPERFHLSYGASGFICPDCGGSLWEIEDEHMLRYRCRIGHAWSPESLLEKQSEQLEQALQVAVRALQEQASLAESIARRARRKGTKLVAERFERLAADAYKRAEVVQSALAGTMPEAEFLATKGKTPDNGTRKSDAPEE